MSKHNDRSPSAERGAIISILAYIFLAFLKLTAGYIFNSKALTADGLNNLTDIIASTAVLIGLRLSKKPPDQDHPYGHSRAEIIASLLASFVMASIGIEVLINAIKSLFSNEQVIPNILGAMVALFGALVMVLVYLYNRSLAKKTGSLALKAASKDNLSDAFVSIGAFVGIVGAQYNLPWLDPIAAIVVGVVIIKTAWEIFIEASHMLSDGFTPEKLEPYREIIESVRGVMNIRDIKARLYGNKVIVDMIIEVDPLMTILEGHNIMDEIETKMKKDNNVIDVHIHIEPLLD